MFVQLGILIIGIAFVYWGSRYLINAAIFLAHKFGVPMLIIGLTVIAFGTSTPELFVGIFSALKNDSALSLGNIIGANLANIGLIVGLLALVRPLKIKESTLRRDFPFVILAPVILYILARDGLLDKLDGVILLVMGFLFIYYALWLARSRKRNFFDKIKAIDKDKCDKAEIIKNIIYFILGLILLLLGAEFLVNSGVGLAKYFGVSDIVIGITLITFGTVLPELFTSIVALIKRQADISLGNLIGSTILNIFIILGIVIIIAPVAVPLNIINFDLLLLVVLTLIMTALFSTGDRLIRLEGAILLAVYFSYIFYLYYQTKLGI